MQNVEIAGCRRRASYPLLQDFGCEGRTGPPCTVVRGDTVTLTVQWESPGQLANLTHQVFQLLTTNSTQVNILYLQVYWESGLVDLPWPGQDTRGCPYLENGCSPASPPGPVTFSFPMTVLGVYPPGQSTHPLTWHQPLVVSNEYEIKLLRKALSCAAGYYYIKHKFRGHNRTGRKAELACFLFDLKIV